MKVLFQVQSTLYLESDFMEEKIKKIASENLKLRREIDNLLAEKREKYELKDIPESSTKEIESSGWNHLGIYFLENGMYSDAIAVYSDMLDTISKIEKEKTVIIHKGLALHNMGVAQLYLRNYDEGIPNILKAFDEDIKTFGKAVAEKQLASKVKMGLFKFLGENLDKNYLVDFNKETGLSADATTLLQNMDETEKLFFAKVINSNELVQFHDDIYTRVVMLDNLANLPLLIEANLKRRSGSEQTLNPLLTQLFKGESWKKVYETNMPLTSYDSVTAFETNLEAILQTEFSTNQQDNFISRSFLATTLMRNFTAHYLNEKLSILSDQKKYGRVFGAGVYSILYCLNATISKSP